MRRDTLSYSVGGRRTALRTHAYAPGFGIGPSLDLVLPATLIVGVLGAGIVARAATIGVALLPAVSDMSLRLLLAAVLIISALRLNPSVSPEPLPDEAAATRLTETVGRRAA
jgi:hypothetical protein